MNKFIKSFVFIMLGFSLANQIYACQFEECENTCDRTFIKGGVPLWTCAEKCAICKG